MNIAHRRSLPVVLGLVLTVGVVGLGSPAHAEGEAPTGSYALDSASIWTGQHVQLTESALADDTTAPDAITRTIAWGDGTTVTADAGATSWTHTYGTAGSYPVTVTLNDGSVDGTGTFAADSTVTVGAVPGTYTWQQPTIYTSLDTDGQAWLAKGTWLAADLPSNASQRWTAWGDGETSLLASGSSTKVPHWFDLGSHSPRISMENGQGESAGRETSPLTVQLDQTAPTVSLTYPTSPNAASSWGTVKGRAADTESGPDVVSVVLYKWNASAAYIYNFSTKKWLTYTGADQSLPSSVEALAPVSSAGTWQVATSGLSKGYHLEIYYLALDKVGNYSNPDEFRSIYLSS